MHYLLYLLGVGTWAIGLLIRNNPGGLSGIAHTEGLFDIFFGIAFLAAGKVISLLTEIRDQWNEEDEDEDA